MNGEGSGPNRPPITFAAVTEKDFDALVALRIAAMQDSLERVGRFDPERARERLARSFRPEFTEFIRIDGENIGFFMFHPADEGYRLDHFYVHPGWQSRGIGTYALGHLLSRADAFGMPVHLCALRGSASNRFYQRHGFVKTGEDEWDVHYTRPPCGIGPA